MIHVARPSLARVQPRLVTPSQGSGVPVALEAVIPARATEGQPGARADALQLYHTGTASDGDTQVMQAVSLGGYRSSTRVEFLAPSLVNPIRGLQIDFIAGANSVGNGQLIAVDANSVAWSPPRGKPGPAVTLSNGQTVRLDGGNRPDQFVIVTRTSANGLLGTSTVQLIPVLNNAIGSNNTSAADAVNYRCVCFKAVKLIFNLRIWILQHDVGLQIGLEQPASQPDGAFTLIADENTAPGSVTFVYPYSDTHPDVLVVERLEPNHQVAVWLKRSPSLASQCSPLARSSLAWHFETLEA